MMIAVSVVTMTCIIRDPVVFHLAGSPPILKESRKHYPKNEMLENMKQIIVIIINMVEEH